MWGAGLLKIAKLKLSVNSVQTILHHAQMVTKRHIPYFIL